MHLPAGSTQELKRWICHLTLSTDTRPSLVSTRDADDLYSLLKTLLSKFHNEEELGETSPSTKQSLGLWIEEEMACLGHM